MVTNSIFLTDKVFIGLFVALGVLTLLLIVALFLLHAQAKRQANFEKTLTESTTTAREKTVADLAGSFEAVRRELRESSNELKESQGNRMNEFLGLMQKASEIQVNNERSMQESLLKQLESQAVRDEARIKSLTDGITVGLNGMRQSLNEQMTGIRVSNDAALKEMRTTVEEKLQETLNARISESFRQVDEQLKSVYNGLGEMRQVAQNVDGLRRVLVNVKTRGTFGEVQLENLLSEILTPDQYEKNVATIPKSSERVEFAIKLPGKENGRTVYLPIDAKFPIEDYEKLLDASERADAEAVEVHAKAIESRILLEAQKIQKKYVEVPYTTEFAILYLPVESLWAEVLKRPGLIEKVHRNFHITIAGPTVLAALLNSLLLGFKTLAIEKKSAEVSELLSHVKSEFLKFSEVFESVEKKVDGVSTALKTVRKRAEIMTKNLRDVETIGEEGSKGETSEAPQISSQPAENV